ncbi:transposase family protein [[Micrococcus luteus] ATCC 49442]|uniref:transposase family protein n=1 Tax=[Micrococcus luteus] ATCC 49442 TaxID=2698727 RepID=UPI003D662F7E
MSLPGSRPTLPSSSSTCPTITSFPPPCPLAGGKSSSRPTSCPSCGVIASRRKERRFQRLRDIPVAGPVDVLWSKYRWYFEEAECDRLSFFDPRCRAVPVPRAGFGTSSWMPSLAPAGQCLRQPSASPCPGGWSALPSPRRICSGFRTWTSSAPGYLALMSTGSVRALLPRPGDEGLDAVRTLDNDHRRSGHRPGPGHRGRKGPQGCRGLAVRPSS